MTAEGISVALHCGALRVDELGSALDRTVEAAKTTSGHLDALELRVARLSGASGASRKVPDGIGTREPMASSATVTPQSWDRLVADAARELQGRGVDPTALDLDTLIDPAEVERLRRRHEPGFTIRADLDRYDVLAAVAAGLTAVVVDALVVRIPKDSKWWTGETTSGSPLTKALRDLSTDSDNWLSQWAKVSYDKVSNLPEKVPGLGPLTHRVQTFGHDPLLGLVMGTLDIMRGTMTAVGRDGSVFVMDTAAPIPNPFLAFTTQIVHLLSDVPTACGLPIPGWVGLTTIQGGSFGPNNESFGEVARRMYLNGYDSWHMLTMMSSVAALELVLRGYWGMRKFLDADWSGDVEHAATIARSSGISDHPKFAAMALAANGIAAAGNLGKFAIYGGNPLAINIAQWLAFVRAIFKWAGPRMVRPTDVLDRHARANAMAIAEGWRGLDFTDPSFPSALDLR